MWQTISKGLTIGLIMGLVLGFAGGYSYKSLNAEAPITSSDSKSTSSTAKTSPEAVSRVLAVAIAGEFLASNNLAGKVSASPGLKEFFVPKAHAATCQSPVSLFDAAEAALSSMFGSFKDGCREAVLTGNVDVTVYGDLKSDDFYVAVIFDASAKITELLPDCSGTEVSFDAKLDIAPIYIHFSSKGGPSEIVDGIPGGLKVICHMSISINKHFGKIDKTKCPYCAKPTPIPGGGL